jgi:hypothetical protein
MIKDVSGNQSRPTNQAASSRVAIKNRLKILSPPRMFQGHHLEAGFAATRQEAVMNHGRRHARVLPIHRLFPESIDRATKGGYDALY